MKKPVEDKISLGYIICDMALGRFILDACGVVMVLTLPCAPKRRSPLMYSYDT